MCSGGAKNPSSICIYFFCRYGFNTPPNYNDHELYCGGYSRQWRTNGGKCGICGDPWDTKQVCNFTIHTQCSSFLPAKLCAEVRETRTQWSQGTIFGSSTFGSTQQQNGTTQIDISGSKYHKTGMQGSFHTLKNHLTYGKKTLIFLYYNGYQKPGFNVTIHCSTTK